MAQLRVYTAWHACPQLTCGIFVVTGIFHFTLLASCVAATWELEGVTHRRWEGDGSSPGVRPCSSYWWPLALLPCCPPVLWLVSLLSPPHPFLPQHLCRKPTKLWELCLLPEASPAPLPSPHGFRQGTGARLGLWMD